MEQGILDFIQTHLNFEILNPFFKVITYSGNYGAIFIIASLVLYVNEKTRKIGLYCLVALCIGALITNVTLKPLIERARPYENGDIILKIMKPMDYSFPSGHTTAGFSVAFVLLKEKFLLLNKKVYLYVIAYACILAYTRLYFYVHYPTDILGGVFVGYVASAMSKHIVDKLYCERGSI